MIEGLINQLFTFDAFWLYVAAFSFAYIENIFPPSPSDVIIAVLASLIAVGKLSFVILLIVSVCGSTLGFLTMFFIGKLFGEKILDKGKFRFISKESIEKTENAFKKYSNILIVLNRFLPGTRAVVSFFIGMSHVNVFLATGLSTISSILWNLLLLSVGIAFGENIGRIDTFLATYNKVTLIVIFLVLIVLIVRWYLKKQRLKKNEV